LLPHESARHVQDPQPFRVRQSETNGIDSVIVPVVLIVIVLSIVGPGFILALGSIVTSTIAVVDCGTQLLVQLSLLVFPHNAMYPVVRVVLPPSGVKQSYPTIVEGVIPIVFGVVVSTVVVPVIVISFSVVCFFVPYSVVGTSIICQ
jgi:hypothetical protein